MEKNETTNKTNNTFERILYVCAKCGQPLGEPLWGTDTHKTFECANCYRERFWRDYKKRLGQKKDRYGV